MRSFYHFFLFLTLCFVINAQAQENIEATSDNSTASLSASTVTPSDVSISDSGSVDALTELKNKASQGDVEAMLSLGYAYLYGVDGTTIDYKKALSYYEQAAQKDSAIAYNNLGSLYFNGIGTDINQEKAISLFEKASQFGSHDASVNLALIFLNSLPEQTDQDAQLKRIFDLLSDAQSDNYVAKFLMGYSYLKGFFVKQNSIEAFKLIKDVADAQYDEAQFVLADLYILGKGTSKNYNRAIEYLQSAVNQGNSGAIVKMADILAEGKIYPKDIKKAHILYNIAAVRGDEHVAEKRDALEASMSIADLLSVQAEAENYKSEPSEQTLFIRKTFGESLIAYIDKNIASATKHHNKN